MLPDDTPGLAPSGSSQEGVVKAAADAKMEHDLMAGHGKDADGESLARSSVVSVDPK